MEIRVRKPFDAARALADLRVIHADRLRAARSFAIATVVIGAGGAALLVASSGMSGLVVLLLVLPAFGIYLDLGSSRSLRHAVSDYPEILRQDALLILTEDRIVQEQQASRQELPWTAIQRVVETDTGWLLFYGRGYAVSIPRGGLRDDQESQFRAFLGTRATAAA
jgi:hypothetical protein